VKKLSYKQRSINCGRNILDLSTPAVMGILNVTPDSFYDGGTNMATQSAIEHARQMFAQGAKIVDIGPQSSRPGAKFLSADEEIERLTDLVPALVKQFPGELFSIDTFHSKTAAWSVERGISIINDISGGRMDTAMFDVAARLDVPIVLMHMQGTPTTMQENPHYSDVVHEVLLAIRQMVHRAKEHGVDQIIVDPGFGFGKNVEQNFELLNGLEELHELDVPLLCGVSRKSMINRVLGTKPDQALNGTTVLNTMCLERGASIIRVHDVKEAMEAVKIVSFARTVQGL
jgi:dihydropteroate synthase